MSLGGRARRASSTMGLFVVVTAAFFVGGAVRHNATDRHPGYTVDLRVAGTVPTQLRVGFSAVAITPDVPDTWTDTNGDKRFNLGEPYEDRNGNNRFDAVWLAGFNQGRAAAGVNDDLWARSMVIDDGVTVVAIVAIDSIGLMHDSVIEIRERVKRQSHVDYVIVCSTHSHVTPDVQGLWGRYPLLSGVDDAYVERVIAGGAESVVRAARSLAPATVRYATVPAERAGATMGDIRRPIVKDDALRAIQALHAETGETLGSFVVWGNHPETSAVNLMVSSDFPHYLREAMERGVRDEERVVDPGLGGTVVYASGAVGGLMTTTADIAVLDPVSGEEYREPSFDKARAQGHALALLAMEALRRPEVTVITEAAVDIRARTITLPLDNRLLQFAALVGVIDRGFVTGNSTRSEIALLEVGPIAMLAVPGEIYPEIVDGGIETPEGADFAIDPVEVPPIRDLMPGEINFVLGLANDAIGYIIPKSEWDNEAPWIYGATNTTYGEIVSLGPETAPLIHAACREIIEDLATSDVELVR